MKKLKKGLSLVLVLVMVFGLATNAFAWDTTYADNDQITYKEAVEAMSGMGIIDGKLDNMFDPAGDYTREQAAKVITYMLLGPEAAKVLEQPTNTGFSDVDAERWSSGYIAYAAAQDIIVGWGGEFHPEDTLTRAQWLKMLLVALGYDPIENGLEDNLNWETNALTLALKVKLIDSKEATAAFNRELAVQYGFKALQTDVVDKDGKPIPDGDDSNKTLSEDIFNLTKKPTQYDEFGRPYETWTGNGKVYATNYAEPVLTYSNETVKVADVEKALGENAQISKIYINGENQTSIENITDLGGKSIEVEIYATQTKGAYTAIVIELQVMKLDKTNLENKAFANFEEDDVVTYFAGKGGVISNVTKLEPVEGTITAVATEYIRLDGEQIFKAENLPEDIKDKLTPSTKVNAYIDSYGNLIYAEVVQPAKPEARQPDGYAQVLDSEAKAGESASPGGGLFGDGATEEKAAAARAKIIDLTGGKAGDKAKVVDIAVVKNAEGTWCYADKNGTATGVKVETSTDSANDLKDTWLYAYYILDDGTYVFSNSDLIKSTNVEIETGKASYTVADQTGYATKDTVLTVVAVDSVENPTEIKQVATYTGYTNFPEEKFVAKKALMVLDDNDTITQLIAVVEATDDGEQETKTKTVYAVSQGIEEKNADGWLYKFKRIDNGAEVSYVAKEQNADLAGMGAIVELTYTLDEKLTAAAKVEAAKTGTVELVQSTYIVIKVESGESQTIYLAKDYLVYGGELVKDATVAIYGSTVEETVQASLVVVTPAPAN